MATASDFLRRMLRWWPEESTAKAVKWNRSISAERFWRSVGLRVLQRSGRHSSNGLDSLTAGAGDFEMAKTARMAAPMALQAITAAAGKKVAQEQLGDLKLYRVPDRTTMASRNPSRCGCSIGPAFR